MKNTYSLRPKSLKFRLLLGLVLSASVMLVVGGSYFNSQMKRYLSVELDHSLTDKMRLIRAACVQRGDRIEIEIDQNALERIHDPDDPEYFQVSEVESGRILIQSRSLAGGGLLPPVGKGALTPVVEQGILPDGRRGHFAGQVFTPMVDGAAGKPLQLHLVLAHRDAHLDEAATYMRRVLIQTGLCTIVVLALVMSGIVYRNLRGLNDLSRQIRSTRVGVKWEPFAVEAAPRELEPVVDRLNELMGRVEEALANERRFTANAAHELRTPLSGLRSQAENALTSPREPEDYRSALREILEIERQLEDMMQSLLLLSRLDAGTQMIESRVVSLRELVRRCWKPYFEAAEAKHLGFEYEGDKSLDEARIWPVELLEIVFHNLFDNAVAYTRDEGKVTASARMSPTGDLVFQVTNRPISQEAMMCPAEMFQAFARGELVRSPRDRHSGIGLALCYRIAAALGGTIRATEIEKGALMLELVIPAAHREMAD